MTRQRVRISKVPCPECGKVQIETLDGKERWCHYGGHELEHDTGVRPRRVNRRHERE